MRDNKRLYIIGLVGIISIVAVLFITQTIVVFNGIDSFFHNCFS